jgi:phosphomannomutase
MKTVLFDMDGTLTEPRAKISSEMVSAIRSLTSHCVVGIVTGSDMNYIADQCSDLWMTILGAHLDNLLLMPCNGTKLYKFKEGTGEPEECYSTDMVSALGKENYRQLIHKLVENQTRIRYMLNGKKIPLTGNFIDCRGTMINWCPIGRNANRQERNIWINLDVEHNVRKNMLNMMFTDPTYDYVDVKLGGSTSFDIYPKGWDKTYAFHHVNIKECYFIGDKCFDHGNDRQIYERVKEDGLEAFSVDNTKMTLNIINQLIEKHKDDK